jgi:hypothetical protein
MLIRDGVSDEAELERQVLDYDRTDCTTPSIEGTQLIPCITWVPDLTWLRRHGRLSGARALGGRHGSPEPPRLPGCLLCQQGFRKDNKRRLGTSLVPIP